MNMTMLQLATAILFSVFALSSLAISADDGKLNRARFDIMKIKLQIVPRQN